MTTEREIPPSEGGSYSMRIVPHFRGQAPRGLLEETTPGEFRSLFGSSEPQTYRREEVPFDPSLTHWDEIQLARPAAPDEPCIFSRSRAQVFLLGDGTIGLTYTNSRWVHREEAQKELRALVASWRARGWNLMADDFESDDPYDDLEEHVTTTTNIIVPLSDCRFFKIVEQPAPPSWYERMMAGMQNPTIAEINKRLGFLRPREGPSIEEVFAHSGDSQTEGPDAETAAEKERWENAERGDPKGSAWDFWASAPAVGWICPSGHFDPDRNGQFLNSCELNECEICGRPRPA
jgi:hypothetical protein